MEMPEYIFYLNGFYFFCLLKRNMAKRGEVDLIEYSIFYSAPIFLLKHPIKSWTKIFKKFSFVSQYCDYNRLLLSKIFFQVLSYRNDKIKF